jgi:perosamine synthetase
MTRSTATNPPLEPPAWPPVDDDIRRALEACYASGDWGRYHGQFTVALVSALQQRWQVEHVSLCCSGTFAVELALRAVGIGEGDEVVLAGYDFPGNFRAIENVGARPVLVDLHANSATIGASAIEASCDEATRAVIVSHLHGTLAHMPEVMAIAARRGLRVVEDACQCPGAQIAGRPAGAWGDVGVLSFGGSKLLSAGRGGAVLTRDPQCHQRAKIFCEHGNHAFPLSELQAAVLVPQVRQLDHRHAHRLRSVERLLARLAQSPMAATMQPLASPADEGEPAYYKLGFWYRPADRDPATRQRLIAVARRHGIPLDAGFRGFLHRGPRRCRRVDSLEQSQRAAQSLVVLHHPVLLAEAEQIDQLADRLLACLADTSSNTDSPRADTQP